MTDKIFKSSEQLEKFPGKMWLTIFKVKKKDFTLSLEDTFSEKAQVGRGGWTDPTPSLFRVTISMPIPDEERKSAQIFIFTVLGVASCTVRLRLRFPTNFEKWSKIGRSACTHLMDTRLCVHNVRESRSVRIFLWHITGTNSKRRIQNPVNHLRWSILLKLLTAWISIVFLICLRKKVYLRMKNHRKCCLCSDSSNFSHTNFSRFEN